MWSVVREHKFMVMVLGYIVLLLAIALSNPKFAMKMWRQIDVLRRQGLPS